MREEAPGAGQCDLETDLAMKNAAHSARVLARARLPGLVLCAIACLAACALHQVPKSEPHGVVELHFEQTSRDFLYHNTVRIDDGEERTVKSCDRIRLRPGVHSLELAAIAHGYGLGTQQVTKPGPCVDPGCARNVPVTETQAAVVETSQTRCAQRLDVTVEANSATVLRLQVAADLTCAAHTGLATGP
jgi:hypothetical protein